ncbi:hypothetical protein HNQ80_002238 [Anaerosolibacter carboniphilus]|uniref:Uncharacterized protein n=1 Tax=Anaerosolibacter carboniphilus TaxID=1417629 RepID=A0A841L179_9FIRM|nr:hypothetical protein [Anaerosolibacter carboniphilus]
MGSTVPSRVQAGVTFSYIEELEADLAKDGYDVTALKKSVIENNCGKALLSRFLELVK